MAVGERRGMEAAAKDGSVKNGTADGGSVQQKRAAWRAVVVGGR